MGKKPADAAKKAAEKADSKAKSDVVSSRASAKTKKKKTKTVETASVKHTDKKCKIKACKRTYRAKGYCNNHYRQWRNGAFGKSRYTACSDTGCFKPQAVNRHGYCEPHFQNFYIKGEKPTAAPAAAPAAKPDEKAAASA